MSAPQTYEIATAPTRKAKRWKNQHMTWEQLVTRCRNTHRTHETLAQYAHMDREQQASIKDVGGFVAAYLKEGLRKTANVAARSMATLDIDYGTGAEWDDVEMLLDCAAMLYSTHKHTPQHPRLRLVVPFSRSVEPHEYEPIARWIAAQIGIDKFDDTTYETARLFYWPSTSADGEYVFRLQEGDPLNVDTVLATYRDPLDCSAWPMSSRQKEIVRHIAKKVGDPTEKQGLIGAYCRAHSITDVLHNELADIYEPTQQPDRYTYKAGSVAGGLVVYDDKFAYSHHDTDPTSRQLCNAFDLVRLHLYGARDEGTRTTDPTKLPSYQEMMRHATADKATSAVIAKERVASAMEDFADWLPDAADNNEDKTQALENVHAALRKTKEGKIINDIANVTTALNCDPNLAGHLWLNDFSGFVTVRGGLPWDANATQWTDRDESNLRSYLETLYQLSGRERIKDAVQCVLTTHRYHPIRDYLNALTWDGVPRLDRLVIDYVGAEDTPLTRAMTRKFFTAAVARVMRPGTKFDYCLVLSGPEGAGKSTLFARMAGDFFSDSLVTMEGKEGMEAIQGAHIVELGELGSVKKSEVEQVKAYLSKTTDRYRPAYGVNIIERPRQCVFCGTTNEELFLRGTTGNRRFWVVRVHPELRAQGCDPWQSLPRMRDQLWAEAVHYYQQGEPLFLDQEQAVAAREAQEAHNEDTQDDPIRDLLEQFLATRLPIGWDTYDSIQRRRDYYISARAEDEADPLTAIGTEPRVEFCAAEFLQEYMRLSPENPYYRATAHKVMRLMDGREEWQRVGLVNHVRHIYGRQRGFRLKAAKSEPEDDI